MNAKSTFAKMVLIPEVAEDYTRIADSVYVDLRPAFALSDFDTNTKTGKRMAEWEMECGHRFWVDVDSTKHRELMEIHNVTTQRNNRYWDIMWADFQERFNIDEDVLDVFKENLWRYETEYMNYQEENDYDL